MEWAYVAGALIVALLFAFALPAVTGRTADRELKDLADSMEAWPIAYVRGNPRARIVLVHGSMTGAKPQLMLIEGDVRTPVAVEDLIAMGHRRSVRWYGDWRGPKGNLGLRHFLWLVDTDPSARALWDRPEEQFMRWWAIIGLSVMIPLLILVIGSMIIEAVWPGAL